MKVFISGSKRINVLDDKVKGIIKGYVNNGDDHTLIFGSTGSKKTRTCVLPFVNVALKAGESVVCTDPKG